MSGDGDYADLAAERIAATDKEGRKRAAETLKKVKEQADKKLKAKGALLDSLVGLLKASNAYRSHGITLAQVEACEVILAHEDRGARADAAVAFLRSIVAAGEGSDVISRVRAAKALLTREVVE